MKPRSALLALAATAALMACGGDSKSAQPASTREDSSGGIVISSATAYKPTDEVASTALVVNLVGTPSTPTPPAATCGDTAPSPETVFWVEGVREGKPLPNERRYTLVSGDCGLAPRLQATVVGGAVNVFNDAGTHKFVFLRSGTSDTLQTMAFTNAGSVVATNRLTTTPGVIEVRCTQHPDERAYIAVFDQPYFGVASTGDKVTLDGLPAGDYQVMTWHEGLAAPVAVAAKVNATGQTEIILR